MLSKILNHTKSDIVLSNDHKDYTPEFMIDGLIKKEGISIIAAERGAGKTRALLWIAYSIIYGLPEVFGYKINSRGDILFISLEIAEKDFKAFTDPIRRHFEKELGLERKFNLFITSFKNADSTLNELKFAIDQHKPTLTIIDSYKLYQAYVCLEQGIKEVNNSNFRKVLAPLEEIIAEFKTTIALINHTNKGTRKLESNADLMFGPGALPDFVDQVTLLRKTLYPNQRIIAPDKTRYSSEVSLTSNLVEIKSTDPLSPYPDRLYFDLLEKDINEADYLPLVSQTRIDDSTKEKIIEYLAEQKGTMEQAATIFLGDGKKKGTVSKIWAKYKNKNS